MPKTRRQLLQAIAEKIGGERGRRMRELIRLSPRRDLLDRELTDEEFAEQLATAERDLPGVLANLEQLGSERQGTWGFPN